MRRSELIARLVAEQRHESHRDDDKAPVVSSVLANDKTRRGRRAAHQPHQGQAIAVGGSVSLARRVTLNANQTLTFNPTAFQSLNGGEQAHGLHLHGDDSQLAQAPSPST